MSFVLALLSNSRSGPTAKSRNFSGAGSSATDVSCTPAFFLSVEPASAAAAAAAFKTSLARCVFATAARIALISVRSLNPSSVMLLLAVASARKRTAVHPQCVGASGGSSTEGRASGHRRMLSCSVVSEAEPKVFICLLSSSFRPHHVSCSRSGGTSLLSFSTIAFLISAMEVESSTA
eukprot:CAMPEP_0113266430 /NCGR_PEP_ID=MMETSP0008_2-20120614/20058_1 /TAXON_ID=97485 /ORGANISM="Prymnesium parvum" /LENGTH=177 /DNA_ID=CAMNT_0000115369 /DNA_START=128 /DNA_END=658 /DNA_ORIENTATION=- /assembly_acc=CAM_ASM_000153